MLSVLIGSCVALFVAEPLKTFPDLRLEQLCEQAAAAAIVEFKEKGLARDQFAIALGQPSDSGLRLGSYRGTAPFYPASVVKLFYLAYSAFKLDAGKLELTPELDRAEQDMIVESSNDATHAVLDAVTGTTGGPEIGGKAYESWANKRNAVNRWLAARGYSGINANQKTWCEGPYGREKQFVGAKYENRNSLTAESTARMMAEIQMGRIAGPERTSWMQKYLSREIPADNPKTDFQARAFIGKSLPSGSKLWSKAGYTDDSRHDVAWFVLPNGKAWVLSVYTKNFSNQPDMIPFVARKVLEGLLVEPLEGTTQTAKVN